MTRDIVMFNKHQNNYRLIGIIDINNTYKLEKNYKKNTS